MKNQSKIFSNNLLKFKRIKSRILKLLFIQ